MNQQGVSLPKNELTRCVFPGIIELCTRCRQVCQEQMHSEVCLLLHELQISSDTIRRDDLDILAQSLPMTCAVAVIVLPYCVLE